MLLTPIAVRRRPGTAHAAALIVIVALVIALLPEPSSANEADSLTVMRQHHVDDLVGNVVGRENVGDLSAITARVTADAQAAWSSLGLGAPPTGELWTDLATKTSSRDLMYAYRRVVAMAVALKTRDSPLFGDFRLRADAISAADWLNANRYNTTVSRDSGWWFWEIGIPIELNDLTALLYEDLSPQQRSRYMAAVARFAPNVRNTGANRVWSAYVLAMRGVLSNTPAKIEEAMTGVAPALADVSAGDGFHADGSFIQHDRFAYTGGYGAALLDTVSRLFHLVDGSPWQASGTLTQTVSSRIESSYAPVIWCSALMSNVRGRNVARPGNADSSQGTGVQTAALRLAETADPEQRARVLSRVKQWLECATEPNTVETLGGVADVIRARLVLADEGIVPARVGAGGAVALNGMDRFIHSSPSFGFSVAMSSSRIGSFEVISEENRLGWYQGTGATSLYTGAGTQMDDYWVTANPYRVPGTTEDTLTRVAGQGTGYKSPETFAGSLASPGQESGLAAMIYDAFASGLTARKAWFTFDDEIVAVGTGIRSTGMAGNGWDGSPRRIETVIDNRRALTSDEHLVVDGARVAPGAPTSANASWAAVVGDGESVGYVFPGTAQVVALDENRTGTWAAINPSLGDSSPVSARHLVLTTSHGRNPTAGRYAYIVLPNADADSTAAYAAAPDVQIIAQTADHIAVHDASTLTTSAVSFVSGAPRELTVSGSLIATWQGAGLLTIRAAGDEVTVTAADPTRVSTDPIIVTLPDGVWRETGVAEGTLAHADGGSTIRFDPQGRRGAAMTVSVRRVAGSGEPTPEPTATPTPESTPEATPTPTPEPTPTETPTQDPTPTPEATPSPTPEPTPTSTPEPSPTPTPEATPTPTPAPTATPSPTPGPPREDIIDSSSAEVSYQGTWSLTSATKDHGGSVRYSSTKSSTATTTFTGTSVTINGRRSPSSGIAEVHIDGVLNGRFDAYAATTEYRQALFTSPTLPAGSHTVTITVIASKSAASAGRNVIIDSFTTRSGESAPQPTPTPTPTSTPEPSPTPTPEATPTPTPAPTATPSPTPGPPREDTIDSSSAEVSYQGTWSLTSATKDHGGSVRYSSTKNSTATTTFTGTSVTINGRRSPSSGIAEVHIDGVLNGRFDAYAATTEYQRALFTSPILPAGPHTVTITVVASKSAASAGRNVIIDSFTTRSGESLAR